MTEGVGLEIEKGDEKVYFLLSYYWKPVLKTFGDITLNGNMAALSLGRDDMPNYLYIVNATRVEKGRFSVHADRNVTLYLERVKEGEYLLENQGPQGANLRIRGEPWRGVKAHQLDAQGRILRETRSVTEGDVLSLKVAPRSRYRLSTATTP